MVNLSFFTYIMFYNITKKAGQINEDLPGFLEESATIRRY